jgi:hypothetical protein
MIVHPTDKPAVQWAVEHGYVFSYVREYGLPEPSLRVALGMSTAFFNAGQLVCWRASAGGNDLDQLMRELASLFGFCTLNRGYLPQQAFATPSLDTQVRTNRNCHPQ